MKILAALTGSALAALSAAHAHDFWLEPERYRAAPGENLAVHFTVGHAGAAEPWNLRLEKVAALLRCAGDECRPETRMAPDIGRARGRALVGFDRPGTHIIAFESRSSFSELNAEAFTDYAKKEGLTAILADRAARGDGANPGREFYSRRAKTLIRVGEGGSLDVRAPVGHTLEIIPLADPYGLRPGEPLRVRVLFEGAPLAGATIDLDLLADKEDVVQTALTDAAGEAAFRLEGAGPFKLMTIWGTPRADRGEADYDTIFASLTFGS